MQDVGASLELLEKDWDIDPLLKRFILGQVRDVSDHIITRRGVAFHIPYLKSHNRYVLWKCLWPDCHNCCERQGRLPLTSSDLITIGAGLGYSKTSEFVRRETITSTYVQPGPSGHDVTTTSINLKRRLDESESDDGTMVPCRFLEGGNCSLHPARPGVCYMYPFSSWMQNQDGRVRVHATYQFTGDCPGFYLSDGTDHMDGELDIYSGIIYRYTMGHARTVREGYGAVSF